MQHIVSLRLSFMIKETHFLSLPFSIIGMPYQDRKMSTRSFYAAVESYSLQEQLPLKRSFRN